MMPDRIVMDSQGRVVKGQKQAADPDRIVMDGLGKVVWREKELPVVEESDKQFECGEKAHVSTRVSAHCPIPGCKGIEADVYEDHGGLHVCAECGATYDPSVRRWQP